MKGFWVRAPVCELAALAPGSDDPPTSAITRVPDETASLIAASSRCARWRFST
jgi:hypothetical protein